MNALVDAILGLVAEGLHELDPAEQRRRVEAAIEGARRAIPPALDTTAEDAARHARIVAEEERARRSEETTQRVELPKP